MSATAAGMAVIGAGCIGGVLLAARVFPGLTVVGSRGTDSACRSSVNGNLPAARQSGWSDRCGHSRITCIYRADSCLPDDTYRASEGAERTGADEWDRQPQPGFAGGAFEWLLPSVVYYSGRKVEVLASKEKVAEFLAMPTPGYLFISESKWNNVVASKSDRSTPDHCATLRLFGKGRYSRRYQ